MLPTVFSLLCKANGLSHKEASEFLGVRLETVRKWHSGKKTPPYQVIDRLVECSHLADALADQVTDYMMEDLLEHDEDDPGTAYLVPPKPVSLGLSVNSEQAESANLPPLAVQKAFVSRMLVWIGTVGGSCEIIPLKGKDRGIYDGIWDDILEGESDLEAEEDI